MRINVAPREALCVALATAAAAIQAWPFLSGVLVTADEVWLNRVAMQGFDTPLELFDWLLYVAKDSGRIGHFLNHALQLAGAAVHEHLAVRIALVGLWFAMMALFALHTTRLVGAGSPAVLFLVMTAFLFQGFQHLPPSSFALRITPTFFLLLAVRLFVYERYVVPDARGTVRGLVLLTPLVWLLVIWDEFDAVFAASLVLFAYAMLAVRERAGLSGVRTVLRRHGLLVRFELIWFAVPLAFYTVFRILKGDAYDGVEVSGSAADALETLVRHVAEGTGLDRLAAFVTASPAPWSLLGGLGAAACLAAMVLARGCKAPARVAIAAILACAAMAALVTLPIAATARYQQWCLAQGTCLYTDSRLSYLWVAAAAYFLVLALADRLAAVPRTVMLATLAALVAAGFLVTHARNQTVAARMDRMAGVFVHARTIACGPEEAWRGLAGDSLERLIDPERLVSMHRTESRPAYWRLYLEHHSTACHR